MQNELETSVNVNGAPIMANSAEEVDPAPIVQFIKDSPGVTIGQIAKQTGNTTDEIRSILKELRTQGIIRSEGARRATRYSMAEVAVSG